MSAPIEVSFTRLTYNDDHANHHKFYEVYVVDREVTLRWGRIGTHGQHKTEHYATPLVAEREARAHVQSKTAGGYVTEIGPKRVSIGPAGYFDGVDLAVRVSSALGQGAHAPTAVSNRLAAITEAANEIAQASKRKHTANLLALWSETQGDWQEISIEFKLAEQAMREAERVITERLMGSE